MSAYTKFNDWSKRKGSGYVITKTLSWEIGRKGSNLWIHVPEGFNFDMSVPRVLQWLFDPYDPRYIKAAALHDYTLRQGWDRVSAAATFDAGLKASGVSRIARLVMVLGVIVFKYR